MRRRVLGTTSLAAASALLLALSLSACGSSDPTETYATVSLIEPLADARTERIILPSGVYDVAAVRQDEITADLAVDGTPHSVEDADTFVVVTWDRTASAPTHLQVPAPAGGTISLVVDGGHTIDLADLAKGPTSGTAAAAVPEDAEVLLALEYDGLVQTWDMQDDAPDRSVAAGYDETAASTARDVVVTNCPATLTCTATALRLPYLDGADLGWADDGAWLAVDVTLTPRNDALKSSDAAAKWLESHPTTPGAITLGGEQPVLLAQRANEMEIHATVVTTSADGSALPTLTLG